MIDEAAALQRCQELVALARKHGADAADAAFGASASEDISVRLGKLEDVSRSESESIGLRAFVGRRSASISTSDFSDAALKELATRVVEMASAAPEDPYAGLAPDEALAKGELPALDLVDKDDPSPQQLREWALACEDAARAVAGVTNSNGGSAAASRSVSALATSNGFARSHAATGFTLSASVVAGEGGRMQTDHAYRSARHAADLPDPGTIGREAGERTVARLDPGSMPSRAMPVVFDPRVGASLIGHLAGAIGGPAVARKASFLIGLEENQLFDPAIMIVDDPLKPRGLASRPFDGEGLACTRRDVIAGGRMTGWLTNVASAAQLGVPLTASASRGGGAPGVRTHNLHMEPGSVTPEALMTDIEEGVFITQVFGQGVSLVTGDYSRGASGFRISGGQIAGPVAEITIAGNLRDMFARLTPANDLMFERAVNVPTLRIDGMTVAGS
ncbi:TldD/PmbA family protein [Qipengyuania sp.]|uniref:TldD/PmbA family protein n=1 Tax=Qipengyuania sp. TaxID=2004515 RepID=UPI0035C85B9A